MNITEITPNPPTIRERKFNVELDGGQLAYLNDVLGSTGNGVHQPEALAAYGMDEESTYDLYDEMDNLVKSFDLPIGSGSLKLI